MARIITPVVLPRQCSHLLEQTVVPLWTGGGRTIAWTKSRLHAVLSLVTGIVMSDVANKSNIVWTMQRTSTCLWSANSIIISPHNAEQYLSISISGLGRLSNVTPQHRLTVGLPATLVVENTSLRGCYSLLSIQARSLPAASRIPSNTCHCLQIATQYCPTGVGGMPQASLSVAVGGL